MTKEHTPRGHSVRTAGIYNVLISGAVALLSYFSLTLIAWKYGGSVGSDAYFFLLSLTTISSGLITSLFGVVVVPIFVDIKVKEGLGKAGEFAGAVLGLCLLLTIPIALSAYVWYEEFFRAVSKYTPDHVHNMRFVLIYFAPIFFMAVLSEYFRVLALALGRYTSAALGAILQPAMLIAFIYVYAGQLAEEALSLSLLIAKLAILAVMLLVVCGVERLTLPLLRKPSAALGRFARVSAPYWSASVITNFSMFYFDYMATGLGAGVLSSVSYAQKIFSLPTTVVLSPILEIARTRFAEARATANSSYFANLHNKLIQFVLYFSIPVSIIYFFFSHEIISSMFQRGAFGKEEVAIAANCLEVFAFSIPASALFMLNGRAIESFQRLVWPSFFGTIGNFLSIFLTFILVNRMGYLGIPLARVAIDALYFLPFGFIALRIFMGQLNDDNLWRVAGIALVSALVAVSIYFQGGLAPRYGKYFPSLGALIMLTVCLGVCYCVFVALLDRRVHSIVLREVKTRLHHASHD